MRDATHIMFSVACGVVAMGFDSAPTNAGWLALGFGSLLPDVDSKQSLAGRYVPFISGRIQRRFGHRTITHCFLGMLIFAVLTSWILLLNPPVFWWLQFGYWSHIFLDAFNVQGVPLLFPHRLEFVSWYNKDWRVRYGSPREMTLLGIFAIFALCLTPMASAGFSHYFHRLIGSPSSAVEDFMKWRDSYDVALILKGDHLPLRERAQGPLKVLDALGRETLLIEDAEGKTFLVGGDEEEKLWGWNFEVSQGKKITVKKHLIPAHSMKLGDVISQIPENARTIYFNAEILTTGKIKPLVRLGQHDRVTQSGQRVTLQSARPSDIKRNAHLPLIGGEILIRSEFVGDSLEEKDNPKIAKTKTHEIEIVLPTMDGLNIHVGEIIRQGDRLARKIDDHKLNTLLLQHDEIALSHTLSSNARLEQIRLDALAVSGLKDKRDVIAQKMQREASLASSGRVPQANVTDLKTAYSQADSEILKAETSLTSLKHAHTQASQRDEITRQKILSNEDNERKSQWIISPHSGEISEVQILETKPNHFHLRITILERLES